MVDKNKKPIDNLDRIKRIRATIKQVLEPAKEIPEPEELRRKNVMWLELQWLKIHTWFHNKGSDVVWYLDKKADLFISESAKQMIRSFWWVGGLILLIVIAMIIKGC
jgi:hypothetical protein